MTKRSEVKFDTPEASEPEYLADGTIVQMQGDKEIRRNGDGKFLPGGEPRPSSYDRSLGRGQRAYLMAIEMGLPAEQIPSYIQQALAFAVADKDWKGVLEVVKTVLAYQIGLPKKTIDVRKYDPLQVIQEAFKDAEVPDYIEGQINRED